MTIRDVTGRGRLEWDVEVMPDVGCGWRHGMASRETGNGIRCFFVSPVGDLGRMDVGMRRHDGEWSGMGGGGSGDCVMRSERAWRGVGNHVLEFVPCECPVGIDVSISMVDASDGHGFWGCLGWGTWRYCV